MSFCFEKGASKQDGSDGFADVWKKDFFGWEYKGKHKDLTAAYDQLLLYRDALASPPLLVVCDLDRIIVHTNFTGTVSAIHEITLDRLGEPRGLEILRAVFFKPDKLRPGKSGEFGLERIRHFNGNLFDGASVPNLPAEEVQRIADTARMDGSAVDPSIFGTLFERGLDPTKRAQLGAHFTGKDDIELLVEAVVMQPLRREWTETQQVVESLLTTGKKISPGGAGGTPAPPGLNHRTRTITQAIAAASRRLDEARRNWLGDRSDKTRTLTTLSPPAQKFNLIQLQAVLYSGDNFCAKLRRGVNFFPFHFCRPDPAYETALLHRQVESREESFFQTDGVREKMHKVRPEVAPGVEGAPVG